MKDKTPVYYLNYFREYVLSTLLYIWVFWGIVHVVKSDGSVNSKTKI